MVLPHHTCVAQRDSKVCTSAPELGRMEMLFCFENTLTESHWPNSDACRKTGWEVLCLSLQFLIVSSFRRASQEGLPERDADGGLKAALPLVEEPPASPCRVSAAGFHHSPQCRCREVGSVGSSRFCVGFFSPGNISAEQPQKLFMHSKDMNSSLRKQSRKK